MRSSSAIAASMWSLLCSCCSACWRDMQHSRSVCPRMPARLPGGPSSCSRCGWVSLAVWVQAAAQLLDCLRPHAEGATRQAFKLLEPTHLQHLGPCLLLCLACVFEAARLSFAADERPPILAW